MRRGARIALLASAVLLCAAWVLLRPGVLGSLANGVLKRTLRKETPVVVRVTALRCEGLHSLVASGVVFLAPVNGAWLPLLTLDQLSVDYNFWALLLGRRPWSRVVRVVRLRGLHLLVLREPDGYWNLSALQAHPGAPSRPLNRKGGFALPALRVEIDDALVVFNDEARGFRSTIDRIQGTLDARDSPSLVFGLTGSTEGRQVRNLALAGAWNGANGSLDARLNLKRVELARYLNYFLPKGGLRFTGGTASLRVLLKKKPGSALEARGEAGLSSGSLRLPGVRVPLSGLAGDLFFDSDSLKFKGVRAHFLGSDWLASGSIENLLNPRADLVVANPAVPLDALSRQIQGLSLLDLSGTASVNATLKGPMDRLKVLANVEAPWIGIVGVELNSVSVGASLLGRHLIVDRVSGSLWGGQLDGRAVLDLAYGGRLAADLTVTGSLLQLARFNTRSLPFGGLASAHMAASGLRREPNLAMDLAVKRLRYGALVLGDFKADGLLTRGGFSGHFSGAEGRARGSVAFSRGAAASFHGTVAEFRGVGLSSTVRTLLFASGVPGPESGGFVNGLPGRIQGAWDADLTVSGRTDSPSVLASLRLADGSVELPARGKPGLRSLDLECAGTLGYRGGELLVGRKGQAFTARLGPPNKGLRVRAIGFYPMAATGWPGKLTVTSSLNLSALEPFGFLGAVRGLFQAAFVVSGRSVSPTFEGGLSVSGFSCEPVAYLAPVRDGSLRAQLVGSEMLLSECQFHSPGLVNVSGNLDFSDGFGGLRGALSVSSDDKGLRFQKWPRLGGGDLVFAPLTFKKEGRGRPLHIGGRVVLSDARITYGSAEVAASPTAPARPVTDQENSDGPALPVVLDLKVGVGSGVWYDRHQAAPPLPDFADPAKWISDTIKSAAGKLLQPDISFRFAPTQRDIIVGGTSRSPGIFGELDIDRGRVTVMENDFTISDALGPAAISFRGGRADVSGTAQERLNYTRYDLASRPYQKSVQVLAEISPRTAAERYAQGLDGQFLNYQVQFDSDPQIIVDDPKLQQTAVLNLILLGDPLVDVNQGSSVYGLGSGLTDPGAEAVGTAGAVDPGAMLAGSGLGAVTTAFARMELEQLLGVVKVPWVSWFDVVRLSPRVRYQAIGVNMQAAGTAVMGSVAAMPQSQYDVDWSLELGKSIGEKLYGSLQAMTFGQNERDSIIVSNQSNLAVQSYGVRGGFEYRLAPYRSIDLYGDFGVDDNLNPLPYSPQLQAPYPTYLVQWRATIPTDNYGTLMARRRRWDTPPGGGQ